LGELHEFRPPAITSTPQPGLSPSFQSDDNAQVSPRLLPAFFPVLLAALLLLPGVADVASAQSLGLGGRTTFVRSEADPEDADARRLTGGVARFRTSPRTSLELAIDYRSTLDDAGRERVREYPVQASVLLMLARTRLAPYLLGGVGWQHRRIETLDGDGAVEDSDTTRRMGAHAGVGAELRVSRRLAVHGDYRYTFLRLGEPDDGTPTAPGALPLPGTRGLQDRMKLRHEGSMWSFGLTMLF
jgi:hypothetical protein